MKLAETQRNDTAQAHLIDAERNWYVASLILSNLEEGSEEVSLHLLRAWEALAKAALVIQAKTPSQDFLDVLPELPLNWSALPYSQLICDLKDIRSALAAKTAGSSISLPSRARLEEHCIFLQKAIANCMPRWNMKARKQFDRTAAMFIVLGGLFVFMISVRPFTRESGPWLAQYFANPYLYGEPMRIKADREIADEMNELGVFPNLHSEAHSVRWISCLKIENDVPVKFELTADDNAALYLDGLLVLSTVTNTPGRVNVTFKPGVHPIVVEYVNLKGQSRILLRAKFGQDQYNIDISQHLVHPVEPPMRGPLPVSVGCG